MRAYLKNLLNIFASFFFSSAMLGGCIQAVICCLCSMTVCATEEQLSDEEREDKFVDEMVRSLLDQDGQQDAKDSHVKNVQAESEESKSL